MKFNELTVTKKANRQRVGRGISAGGGKTAGRGTKGQKSRTGKKLRAGFEGGQNPLMMRIPKLKGFKSNRVKAQVVYTDNLALVSGKIVDNQTLAEAVLISSPFHSVKIISRGEVKKALTVRVQAASAGAQKTITKAGGTFETTAVLQREPAKRKKES